MLGSGLLQGSETDWRQLLQKTEPALAKLGIILKPVPLLVTTKATPVHLDPEQEAQLRWQFPDLRLVEFPHAREALQLTETAAALCRFDADRDTMFVFPENAAKIAAWDRSLAQLDAPTGRRLAMVHAIALSYLERKYALSARWARCRDDEEFRVLQALVHGRALWLTRCVSRQIDAEACFPALMERYLHLPDLTTDNVLRMVCQETARRRRAAALAGLEFFEILEQRGNAGVEAQVFAQMPRQYSWIERPARYLEAVAGKRADLSAQLIRLKDTLPVSQWSVDMQPWLPAMVLQVAALVGQEQRAQKVLASWEEAQSLVWSAKDHSARNVSVSVARFECPAAARSYVSFSCDLQRKRDELSGGACTPAMQVMESQTQSITLAQADEAIRSDKKIRMAPNTPVQSVSVLVARAGTLVIEFSWFGEVPNIDWVNRVLATLLLP